jgi:lincosamide nucleotidyltransferase
MLAQERLITRVRDRCRDDDHLDAAMMYGSFAYGEGDAYSDIEFLLFFDDEAFPHIDRRAWLEQIAPVAHLYVNEHGITAVIFENLIRGEFHFHSVSEMGIAQAWPGVLTFPTLDATLIVDKSGRLAPYLEPIIGPPLPRTELSAMQFTADSFVNWFLLGYNVLRRGEHARALEILTLLHRFLLHMARALEGHTEHWLTPSRALERDISPEAYARFRECTAPLDPAALWRAYGHVWQWGNEMLAAQRTTCGIAYPDDLCQCIAELINREQKK